VIGATSSIAQQGVMPAMVKAGHSVVAVASRSREPDPASGYGSFGAVRAYTGPGSYQAAIDDPDVDAVYVPVPNGGHRQWVERAAAAGRHVLCEKPLAPTAADATAMAEACASAGVVLAEAYMTAFHPRSPAIAETVASGGLGDLRIGRAGFTFTHPDPTDHRFDQTQGGGALLDVGIYCLAPLLAAAGRAPVGVAAIAAGSHGVDTTFTGLLDFGSGFAATIECSFEAPERQYLEIIGTRGALVVDRAFTPGPTDDSFGVVRIDGTLDEVRCGGGDSYLGMVEAFAAVVAGESEQERGPLESIALLSVVDRLRSAAGLLP